jgi:hypothetical protein
VAEPGGFVSKVFFYSVFSHTKKKLRIQKPSWAGQGRHKTLREEKMEEALE